MKQYVCIMNKSIKIKSLTLIAAFLLGGYYANAQLKNFEMSLFINGNIPAGEFGQRVSPVPPMLKDNMGQGAMIGIGGAYRASYHFDIGYGEVTPFLEGNVQWNALKGDMRDDYAYAQCDAPNYINIPLYFGVNYRYQLTDIFTPFVEGGLGGDFLMITHESVNNTDLRYKPTAAFAWEVGLGTYLTSHVSFSFHYMGYGKHAIEYTESSGNAAQNMGYTDPGVVLRSLGTCTFRIGFHF